MLKNKIRIWSLLSIRTLLSTHNAALVLIDRETAQSRHQKYQKKIKFNDRCKKSISYSYLNIKAGKNPNYNSYEAFLKYVLRVNKFKSKTSFAQPFNKITQSVIVFFSKIVYYSFKNFRLQNTISDISIQFEQIYLL